MDTSQGTTTANRRALIALLRNPPEDFKWDFSTYGNPRGTCGCAYALALRIGLVGVYRPFVGPSSGSEILARVIGLPTDYRYIFNSWRYYRDEMGYSHVQSHNDVTAKMVADALERIDAHQEEPVSHLTGREQDAAAGLVPLSTATPAAAPVAPGKTRLDPFPTRALHYSSGDGG